MMKPRRADAARARDATSLEDESLAASSSLTGMDTFTLEYRAPWPTSLVLSRKALTKYQLLFRHVFHCKHVERRLCAAWRARKATRGGGGASRGVHRTVHGAGHIARCDERARRNARGGRAFYVSAIVEHEFDVDEPEFSETP